MNLLEHSVMFVQLCSFEQTFKIPLVPINQEMCLYDFLYVYHNLYLPSVDSISRSFSKQIDEEQY